MIASYRRSDGAATDHEIAWLTVALRDLGVMDDIWFGMDWISCICGCGPMRSQLRATSGRRVLRAGSEGKKPRQGPRSVLATAQPQRP